MTETYGVEFLDVTPKCEFGLAWIGKCGKPNCAEHADLKCASCGARATHQCAETMGLVCGADLCDDCEHTIRENGCNSGAPLPEGLKGHCKKSEQVWLPWYAWDDSNRPQKAPATSSPSAI